MKTGKHFCIFLILLAAFCLHATGSQAASGSTPQQRILEQLGTRKAVIFNGDDMGRTAWSNQGILEGFHKGMVTSTSLMVPSPALDGAYEIIKNNPDMDAGIHLALTRDAGGEPYGPLTPADKVPTIVDENGNFSTGIKFLANADAAQVRTELTAQIEHALANGVDVTHLDCHAGWYHDYNPKLLKIVLDLAVKYQLPIRWHARSSDAMLVKKGIVVPDHLLYIDGKLPFERKKKMLLETLNALQDGIFEFVLHPATDGYTDVERAWRTGDLALMQDPDVRAALEKNGIKLVGYRALRDMQRRIAAENAGK